MAVHKLVSLGADENGEEGIGVLSKSGKMIAEMRLEYGEDAVSISYFRVSSKNRRTGVGTFLLQSVMDIIALRGVFTPCVCSFIQEDTKNLDSFFEAQPNFAVSRDSHMFMLSPEARKENRFWKKITSHFSHMDYYFEQSDKARADFMKKVERRGFSSFVDDREKYEEPLCLADVIDGEIKAVVLFKKNGEKELEFSFVFTDPDNRGRLPKLFSAAAEIIDHEYADCNLWFCVINPGSHALTEHLINGDVKNMIEKKTVCRAGWLGWSINEVKGIYSVVANNKGDEG